MSAVVSAWGLGFLLTLLALGAGIAVGWRCSKSREAGAHATYLQWVGMALLLWATVGIAGWEVQTFDGSSTPEVANRWIYRILHVSGTFFLVWSVAWTWGSSRATRPK